MLQAILLATAAGGAAPPGPPGPRYYVILFAGQSVPFRPPTAHTWATFVRATPTPAGPVDLDVVTISWLPAGRDVRVLRLWPVPGENHTLEDTFRVMAGHNAQVGMWGPYETDAGRYERAARQAAYLGSGAARYRVLDSLGRNRRVFHCVHAVTHADPVLDRKAQPVLRVGEPGTSRLAAMYRDAGAFVGYPQTHDWLLPALGLDRMAIDRHAPGDPVPRRWR